MTLEKPKAVLFDWDDTIIDSWNLSLESLNAALTAMGAPAWSDAEARRRAGPSARDLFREMFGERWQEADKIFLDRLSKLFRERIPVYADVKKILEVLAGKGVYLAVVSNKRGHLLRDEAQQAGLAPYFARIVGAGDAAFDKPNAAVVAMALDGSGIEAGRDVWFVGDSHTDMLCAVNAGCTGLLLETKPPPEEMLVNNPPLRRFKNHNELMEFIVTVV